MDKRRTYTAGFKKDVLALVADPGESAAKVTEDLGILSGLLQSWLFSVRTNPENDI